MKIDAENKTVSLDIRDPAFYNDPYPTYERLQSQVPMFYWEEHGLWTFTKHYDVASLLRDRRLGRRVSHVKTRKELGLPDIRSKLKPFFDIDQLSMLGHEPPEHTRLRGLVQKAFMARSVEQFRPKIEGLCRELIDSFKGKKEINLLNEYATPIPVLVIADMLGVPRAMTNQLLDWSHAMVQMYEMQRTTETEMAAVTASQEFVGYLRELVKERRKDPHGDLISELIAVEAEGERLTEDELIANCILLLNAGHEATVNVIGNGVLALLKNSKQANQLRGSPSMDQIAVEELMRYDTPLHQFNRWVLEPFEIHGQQFEVGDEIALLLGAANRDAEVFTEPHTLDLGRDPNPHVGLGGGIHYCLGAPLARLELQIAIPMLVRSIPELSLSKIASAEEPQFRNNYHFHGLESLVVDC